uniref:Uncharacterized protein n=1 Tax=Ditylenchus dipsaci TaxID=166011 RepID=A0A915DY92_9BILA
MNIKKVWNSLWWFSPYCHKPNIKLTVTAQRCRTSENVEKYMRIIFCKKEFDKVVDTGEAVVILRTYERNQEELSDECARAYFAAVELYFQPKYDFPHLIPVKKLSTVTVIVEENGTPVAYPFEVALGNQIRELHERLANRHDQQCEPSGDEAQGKVNESVADDQNRE